MYGRTEDYHLDAVETLLSKQNRSADPVQVIRLNREVN